MKGIIIAGGLGTRLRPLTYLRPKPLVSLANRPFLEYQVALLKKYGIEDIVFATNYMADRIEAHFGDGSRFGVRMRYAIEESPLGTGGAIRNAADMFPGETVAVFNGDILTDFNLGDILKFHTDKNASATITLAAVPGPSPFGVLILNESGEVLEWREPSEETKKALAADRDVTPEGIDLINAGFYVLSPQSIERIPQGQVSSVERDIFPKMIAERVGMYGFSPGGFWMDVGRPEQLMTATQATLSGSVKTALGALPIGEGTRIAPNAWISGQTTLGKNCVIGNGSRIEGSILMDSVTIGNSVRVSGVIVDENTVIEDESVIEGHLAGAVPVISAGSVLRKGTRLRM